NYTSGNVYVVLQTTFTNPVTPGTLDTSESYGGYGHSDNDLFGQLWQSPSIGVAYYGERSSGVTIPVGSPVTLVIKYELNGVRTTPTQAGSGNPPRFPAMTCASAGGIHPTTKSSSRT